MFFLLWCFRFLPWCRCGRPSVSQSARKHFRSFFSQSDRHADYWSYWSSFGSIPLRLMPHSYYNSVEHESWGRIHVFLPKSVHLPVQSLFLCALTFTNWSGGEELQTVSTCFSSDCFHSMPIKPALEIGSLNSFGMKLCSTIWNSTSLLFICLGQGEHSCSHSSDAWKEHFALWVIQ